jgi:hypothetical protein
MSFPFDNFDVSPSYRTPNPTNFHPHEPCSHYSSPYDSLGDCPHWRQFSNFSHKQMNTSFSSPRFESNSNFYNPDWSNHSDFSWQAHVTEIMLPKLTNCTILIIRNSTTNFLHIHHMTILLSNLLWKKLLRNSWN